MKKFIIPIVLVLTSMSMASCQDIYESAYESEMYYKAKKENPAALSGSLESYEAEFMQKYEAMDEIERRRYKAYRERENKRAEREYKAMKQAQAEAIEMLNN